MKQTMNIAAEAATDEPASPPVPSPGLFAPSVSTRLTESLMEPALSAGLDPRPGRAQREDGWTPERIRIFLEALAEYGVVGDAARAAGMSARSAYKLRRSAGGRPFHYAWRAALQHACARIEDEVMSRAIHGCKEVIVRDGQVVGERHRFDNRLTMAVLANLQKQAAAEDGEGHIIRFIAEEFDRYLDIVCAGDAVAANEFIATRANLGAAGHHEEQVIERNDNYQRYGVGLPEEIEIGDLDPEDMESWTEEQAERAERSGMLEALGMIGKRQAKEAEIEEAIKGGWAFRKAGGGVLMWGRPRDKQPPAGEEEGAGDEEGPRDEERSSAS